MNGYSVVVVQDTVDGAPKARQSVTFELHLLRHLTVGLPQMWPGSYRVHVTRDIPCLTKSGNRYAAARIGRSSKIAACTPKVV